LENENQITKNRHWEILAVYRSITDWNHLPERVIGTSHAKKHIFKMSVGKVKTSEGK